MYLKMATESVAVPQLQSFSLANIGNCFTNKKIPYVRS